jgi:hypothetical protein
MQNKQEFKRILFNDSVENYLIFNITSQKKLLIIIKNLKELFPKKKYWNNIEEDKDNKQSEILSKFRKKGKFYKKICKNWLTNNIKLIESFNEHFKSTDKEISTEEVLKFFENLKKENNLNIKDIILFVHIYIEETLGISLFKDSAKKLEKELKEELN